MAKLPPLLEDLVRKSEQLVGPVDARLHGTSVTSVEDLLRTASSTETDRSKRVKISGLLNQFLSFYRGLATSKQGADAQILIRDTQAYAYLTLLPPRSGGRMVDFAAIMANVNRQGIRRGLNHSAIEAAANRFSRKPETIWQLQIASCVLPQRGEDAQIHYRVPVFDKAPFFGPERFEGDWGKLANPVKAGQKVASIRPPGPGKPGVSVRGDRVEPPPGDDLRIRLGEGLQASPNGRDVHAVLAGVVTRDDDSVDVVPMYVVEGDLFPGQVVNHKGHVLVTGNVIGPVSIHAEDIYVQGTVEGAQLYASGDVYVGFGIVGKNTGTVEADGRVHARSIADTTIEALSDVVARNSITYSDVTSNGEIRVTAERGAIVGGAVSALRGIVARDVGSDFGTHTSTAVGVNFLTVRRLKRIEKKMKEYEKNLAKIDLLKRRVAQANIDVRKLPPEKQDLFISVLQKEMKTREELNSLRRSKEKFDGAMKEFLQATIRVLENLHPPVKVRIGGVIEEIRERMRCVTLVLDHKRRISARTEE